ncbi:IS3 family transposase [Streptomyces sp. NBC_00654]|uniref:IS3 family transposase n=1 Tax=Streptomyces sp. NBC_00654 TaxID=2975799 RepID=UPI00338EA73D
MQIREAYDANYRVYGARKIWRHLNRQGQTVARCTVERLMRELGITGAVRGRRVITTMPDPSSPRAPDLVDRDFVASAPNRCWMAGAAAEGAHVGAAECRAAGAARRARCDTRRAGTRPGDNTRGEGDGWVVGAVPAGGLRPLRSTFSAKGTSVLSRGNTKSRSRSTARSTS